MSNQSNPSEFFSSRPRIFIDGQEQQSLQDRLISMTVEERIDGNQDCIVSLDNWGAVDENSGYLYFDRALLDFGRTITIRAGHQDAEREIFRGRIVILEGNFPSSQSPEITIHGEDRLQDLRMTRRTRSFTGISESDVIRQIAMEHGLTSVIDIQGTIHPVLAQVNQTDLAFIRNRARAVDAELWIEGDTLYAMTHFQRNSGEVVLTYGEDLLELSIKADLTGQCTSLTVSGWDNNKSELSFQAGEEEIENELHGHKSGSEILQETIGLRDEQIVHQFPNNLQEAQTLAQSFYRSTARKFVNGQGVCQGDARIRVGTHLEIQGIGELFNGKYYVIESRHTFTQRDGYLTHFNLERPGLGPEIDINKNKKIGKVKYGSR